MLIWIAVLAAAVLALPLLLEKRMIYFPFRTLEVSPGGLGLRHEEARLVTEDGVAIHGWLLPVEGSRFTVLMAHGNAGNISHRLDRVLLMHSRLKTDVFLFDYRGYGRSEGSPDEEGTYRDARAAYRYLVSDRGVDPGRLVVFGESLGAAVALQLALESPCRALVLEAPFASIAQMARTVIPFWPLGSLLRTRYDNVGKVGRLKVPLLVLHGEDDRTVPFAQGRRVFEAAPEPKRFFAIPAAGHNDTYLTGGDAYWAAWKDFLDGLSRP